MSDEPADLDELRERLRATREAAEKLAGRVPPQGWASASDEERTETAAEVQALVAVLHALRDLVPADLWDDIREIVRRLLLLLRALLDLVVERLGAEGGGARSRSGSGPDLQDIPIA
jgi:negative regulator of replication initiation